MCVEGVVQHQVGVRLGGANEVRSAAVPGRALERRLPAASRDESLRRLLRQARRPVPVR